MCASSQTVWDEGEKGERDCLARTRCEACRLRESHASALLFVKPTLRKHDLAVELTCMTNCL